MWPFDNDLSESSLCRADSATADKGGPNWRTPTQRGRQARHRSKQRKTAEKKRPEKKQHWDLGKEVAEVDLVDEEPQHERLGGGQGVREKMKRETWD